MLDLINHKHELSKCTSKQLFASGEVRIELIEEVCCKSEAELVKREGEIMRLYPNRVNKFLAGRTQAEYVKEKKKQKIAAELYLLEHDLV